MLTLLRHDVLQSRRRRAGGAWATRLGERLACEPRYKKILIIMKLVLLKLKILLSIIPYFYIIA